MTQQLAGHAERAEYSAQRAERLAAATAGRTLADICVAQQPEDPACYYYRAVLTGRYYAMTVLGYHTGLRQMIADCERLLRLDPAFADAGAYRILGQIYTQIPETAFRPDSLTRDLLRARGYLEQAVALAPHHVENPLALCETLVALEAWPVAQVACRQAGKLLAAHRPHPGAAAWRNQLRAAKKRLAQQAPSSLASAPVTKNKGESYGESQQSDADRKSWR